MKHELTTGDRMFFAVLIKPFGEEAFNDVIAEALGIETVSADELQAADAVGGDTAAGTGPGTATDTGQMRDRPRAIRQAAGSESVADSLFLDFLAALPMAMTEIDAAFAARKWQALWQATHKLQGAAAICSLSALHVALVELARAARKPEVPGLVDAMAAVRHEVDRLIKQ
jgi:HPt (histidine-containing phosphotransfer) domain-containing protein